MTIKWVSFEATCVCGQKFTKPKDAAQHIRDCNMFNVMSKGARQMVIDRIWGTDDG